MASEEEVFKIIGLTITRNKTTYSDGYDPNDDSVAQAKEFDGNDTNGIKQLMWQYLQDPKVAKNKIDVKPFSEEGSDTTTFVGTYQSKDPEQNDPGDAVVRSHVVSIVAKKV